MTLLGRLLDQGGGSIAYRFHARDAHLVLSPGAREPIPFHVLRDGRLYQHDAVRETRAGAAASRVFVISGRSAPR